MRDIEEIEKRIDQLLEEEAGAIGELAEGHSLDEHIASRMITNLVLLRHRILNCFKDEDSEAAGGPESCLPKSESHPAIIGILLTLKNA